MLPATAGGKKPLLQRRNPYPCWGDASVGDSHGRPLAGPHAGLPAGLDARGVIPDMTLRSLLIGLLLGLPIAAFGFFNDYILNQSKVASDLIPISVYGLLVLALLTANPLLHLVRRARFAAGEWAVIISMMLMACVIPGPGLMWQFGHALVLPHMYQRTDAGWQDKNLLSYAPPILLIDPGKDYETAVLGFKSGLRKTDYLSFGQVPWGAWTRTLSFWMPFVSLSFLAGICLMLVIHRQWAHRERLRYPVADFASELVRGAEQTALPSIFHNRLFWLGFVPVVAVLLVNGFQAYYPQSLLIPLNLDLRAVAQKWPALNQVQYKDHLLSPNVFFAAIGFAYFVSSEASFSIGISHILYTAVFLSLLKAGVDMGGDYLAGGKWNFNLFGAYLGAGLMVAYLGRRFYTAVFLKATGIARLLKGFGASIREDVQAGEVWACRLALLAAAGMVVMLWQVLGLGIAWSILFILLSGLLFLIVARVNTETGLFFIQPTWHAVGVIMGVFGVAFIGPKALITMALLSTVMTIDPRVSVMPLAANALRFSENAGVRPYRLGAWMVVAILIAFVAGVVGTLYFAYNDGASYDWAIRFVPKLPFDLLGRELPRMESVTDIRVDRNLLGPAIIGLGLVLGCGVLRLRYNWWPLHPVLFLMWGTFPMARLAPSFLVGWLIKVGITSFGGGQSYRKSKPVFIGMVAGEFVAGIFWMIVALVYYKVMGQAAPKFEVHP